MQTSSRHIALVPHGINRVETPQRVATCPPGVSTPLWLLYGAHCLELLGFSPRSNRGETHLVFLPTYVFFLLPVEPGGKTVNGKLKGKQTESSFQSLWPIIKAGCGFEAEVNNKSVLNVALSESRSKWSWSSVKHSWRMKGAEVLI